MLAGKGPSNGGTIGCAPRSGVSIVIDPLRRAADNHGKAAITGLGRPIGASLLLRQRVGISFPLSPVFSHSIIRLCYRNAASSMSACRGQRNGFHNRDRRQISGIYLRAPSCFSCDHRGITTGL